MRKKVIEMKKQEWTDKLLERISKLEDSCFRKDKEIENFRMETLSIISIAINELQRNDYGKPEIKNTKALEYLKEQHSILAKDIAIENDEKILELPYNCQTVR